MEQQPWGRSDNPENVRTQEPCSIATKAAAVVPSWPSPLRRWSPRIPILELGSLILLVSPPLRQPWPLDLNSQLSPSGSKDKDGDLKRCIIDEAWPVYLISTHPISRPITHSFYHHIFGTPYTKKGGPGECGLPLLYFIQLRKLRLREKSKYLTLGHTSGDFTGYLLSGTQGRKHLQLMGSVD